MCVQPSLQKTANIYTRTAYLCYYRFMHENIFLFTILHRKDNWTHFLVFNKWICEKHVSVYFIQSLFLNSFWKSAWIFYIKYRMLYCLNWRYSEASVAHSNNRNGDKPGKVASDAIVKYSGKKFKTSWVGWIVALYNHEKFFKNWQN